MKMKRSYDDDYYLDDTYGLYPDDDDCELKVLDDKFALPSATFFLAPDTTDQAQGTPGLPGTIFLWDEEVVMTDDGIPLNATTVSGTCTRTSASQGGICQLVFVDTNEDITINIAGFLPNPLGGPLAVTGGTGDLFGNIGEMDLFPIFEATTGDVFLDAIRYDVTLKLGIIVCPPQ